MTEGHDKPIWYGPFAATIRTAGFYTSGVENKGDWDRTTVCSEGEHGVLGGNSFWVTYLAAGWFIGTWGGMIYTITDEQRVAEFCIAWLRRACRLESDFGPEIKGEFGLIPVSDEEFNLAAGRSVPES